MALTQQQQRDLAADVMREFSARRDAMPFSKAQLLTTIENLDAFVEAQAATINQQFVPAVRATLTARQKAELLHRVTSKRWEAS